VTGKMIQGKKTPLPRKQSFQALLQTIEKNVKKRLYPNKKLITKNTKRRGAFVHQTYHSLGTASLLTLRLLAPNQPIQLDRLALFAASSSSFASCTRRRGRMPAPRIMAPVGFSLLEAVLRGGLTVLMLSGSPDSEYTLLRAESLGRAGGGMLWRLSSAI
jgi:hypothetical protein